MYTKLFLTFYEGPAREISGRDVDFKTKSLSRIISRAIAMTKNGTSTTFPVVATNDNVPFKPVDLTAPDGTHAGSAVEPEAMPITLD
jgi:hypothetical protein